MEILEWGFDGGVRALEATGHKLGDDLVNDRIHEYFANGLFRSFAQVISDWDELRRAICGSFSLCGHIRLRLLVLFPFAI